MGKEAMNQAPKNPAKNKMNAIMPKNDMDVSGLVSVEEQNLKDRTMWTEVNGKRYEFIGKSKGDSLNQQDRFIEMVNNGTNPKEAYEAVTGKAVEKIKKLSEKEIKYAIALIEQYNGAKLARLLGYKNCQQAIDSSRTLTERFKKMGFEPYDAANANKVILDGAGTHFVNGKSATQMARRKIQPLNLETKEDYARSQMSTKELSDLKAKETEEERKAEELASQEAVDNLF